MNDEEIEFYREMEQQWIDGLEKFKNGEWQLYPEYREHLKEKRAEFVKDTYTSTTGMCLGTGWHGGMTSEEWIFVNDFEERVIAIIDEILSL